MLANPHRLFSWQQELGGLWLNCNYLPACKDFHIVPGFFSARAQDLHLISVNLNGLGFKIVVQFHPQFPGDGAGFHHGAHPLLTAHRRAHSGGDAVEFFICFLLIFQATHQSAAGAADFGGVE